MDCLDITDWEVKQTHALADAHHPNVLRFSHQDYTNQYVSMDSNNDFNKWKDNFQKMSRSDLVYGSAYFESSDSDSLSSDHSIDERDAANQCRQTLLEELQKHRETAEKSLQDRQANRQETSSLDTDPGSEGTDRRRSTEFITVDDDHYKDMTHLMQRKISMQFKLESVQKHLSDHNKRKVQQSKPKKFKLFKSTKSTQIKPPVTPQQEALNQQVLDLSSRLTGIKMDMEERKQKMNRRSYDSTSRDISPKDAATSLPSRDSNSNHPRMRKHGLGSLPSFSFSTADINVNTGNLSRKQRDRIKAVGETHLRRSWSSGMFKSTSSDALFKSWSNKPPSPDVILEETTQECLNPATFKRLFSRDSSEANVDEVAEPNLDHQSPLQFSLSTDSSESPLDTPMKDMVCRNNNNSNKKDVSTDAGHCNVCLSCPDVKLSHESHSQWLISDFALAHISEFEDFLQTKLGQIS